MHDRIDSDTIYIKKKNHAYLHVDAEPSIRNELYEYFSFYIPNYKFMKPYKDKQWDGKIYLYNPAHRQLYCGLFTHLKKFADTDGRKYKVVLLEDSKYGYPNDKGQDVDLSILSDVILTSKGNSIDPHDYQIEAVKHALKEKRAMIISPTASGKSLIIYLLIRYFLKINNEKRILIIVPTTSLVEQMYSDFDDYSQKDKGFDSSIVSRIYSGKDKNDLERYKVTRTDNSHFTFDGNERVKLSGSKIKYKIAKDLCEGDEIEGLGISNVEKIYTKIVCSTWQSVYKMPEEWFSQFGMIVGDEAHNFKAKSLTTILTNLKECEYRYGTTGTLDDTTCHTWILEGLFGPIYSAITTKKLIDSNRISDLKINILLLKYKKQIREFASKLKYQDEMNFIVTNAKRNNFITNLALDQKGNTLVLFQYVEKHGKVLYELIKRKAYKKRKIFFVSGETEVNDRESIRSITEKEKDIIEVILKFGDIEISVLDNTEIKLSDGSVKLARDITKNDDVSDEWIAKNRE